jgi:hypothetical protein
LIQPFVPDAPATLIFVSGLPRMDHTDDWDESVSRWANTAVRVENVYAYCACEGLATVCGAMFDRPALTKALMIPRHQMVTLHQVVGYPA